MVLLYYTGSACDKLPVRRIANGSGGKSSGVGWDIPKLYAPVPLTILTSSDAHLIPKMRKFQRSDEFR